MTTYYVWYIRNVEVFSEGEMAALAKRFPVVKEALDTLNEPDSDGIAVVVDKESMRPVCIVFNNEPDLAR